jgi:hypothetical protein
LCNCIDHVYVSASYFQRHALKSFAFSSLRKNDLSKSPGRRALPLSSR